MTKKLCKKILIVIVVVLLLSGCSAKQGAIVRHDITYDDLDIFYMEIKPRDLESALGLPHFFRSDGKDEMYYYNFDKGYIEVYFTLNKYRDNSVTLLDQFFQPHPYMNESPLNKQKIDNNKYMKDIRYNIDINEIEFINIETTSIELQNVLGPPHGMSEYTINEGTSDEFIFTAYLYVLDNDEVFKVCYFDAGNILRAWVEDQDGKEKVVFVEIPDETA